jgi:hypothetical protein
VAGSPARFPSPVRMPRRGDAAVTTPRKWHCFCRTKTLSAAAREFKREQASFCWKVDGPELRRWSSSHSISRELGLKVRKERLRQTKHAESRSLAISSACGDVIGFLYSFICNNNILNKKEASPHTPGASFGRSLVPRFASPVVEPSQSDRLGHPFPPPDREMRVGQVARAVLPENRPRQSGLMLRAAERAPLREGAREMPTRVSIPAAWVA